MSHKLTGQLLDDAKPSSLHNWITHISAQALFLSGFNFFVISLVIPFLVEQWHISVLMVGLTAAAAPIGAIVGAAILGYLADHTGRKKMIVFSAVLILLSSIGSVFSWDIYSLFIFRLLLGIGLGADYPISASYLCETLPKNQRGRRIAAVMFINNLGTFVALLSSYLILQVYPNIEAWRIMLLIGIVPALVILCLRLRAPESPRWLLYMKRYKEANQIIREITKTDDIVLDERNISNAPRPKLLRGHLLKITVISAVVWFCMDCSIYGVGIFTPQIIHSLKLIHATDFIKHISELAKATVIVNCFTLIGAYLGILLIDRTGRLKLQIYGFFISFIGLVMLAISHYFVEQHMLLIYIGFIVFNLAINAGPSITTFILPAEYYPTSVRAFGHGVATACGKAGAVISIAMFPLVQKWIGITPSLMAFGVVTVIAGILTFRYKIETKQLSIDEISQLLQQTT